MTAKTHEPGQIIQTHYGYAWECRRCHKIVERKQPRVLCHQIARHDCYR